ncbi:S41 family peptidase [Flavobacteriaceae bacterium F08102]|nr:S41 family peptidase [Flavobacteriaceae bacterium F08102]
MKKIKRLGIIALLLSVITISVGYKSDFFEVAKQLEIYTTLFKELNMYYIDETNPAELTEVAIDKMLSELDPYTRFYDEQGVERARINANGQNGGIGAETKIIDGKLVITEPYEASPADKSGLLAGDIITKINDISLDETPPSDAQLLLNGNPDSAVNLTVLRQGKTVNVRINRTNIDVDPVPYYQMLNDEVGYISFIKFNDKASARVKESFEDLKAQGMQKLILDMRGNLGGLLNEAVEITNFFIPKNEVVVTTKAKVKKWSDTYKTKRDPLDLEIPIVVLIDHKSASASEIVAGSLQDLDRAVIVGERSFGKGLVQRYRELTYGTQLKLTIAKYYTPSGRCIQELDYTHRDKNGKVPKFSENQRNAFQTKNGRTVYDGGGIEPDIKLASVERSQATKDLLNSDAFFNFAVNYYQEHKQIPAANEFKLSEADFNNFIDFIQKEGSGFVTTTDHKLADLLQEADKEGYANSIKNEFNALVNKIKKEKVKELLPNKSEIKDVLSNEIVRKYYYKKGEFIRKVNHDQAVIEAVNILKDQSKYQKILN